jgi:hypothetical protein
MDLLTTLTALVSGLIGFSEVFFKGLKDQFKVKISGIWSLVVTWIFGIGATMLAAYINIEWFESFPFTEWYWTGLLWGVVVSLCANGLFKLEWVQKILIVIKVRKK